MRVAAVITARGGSKSIYKKNIIQINGKPLLFSPVQSALESKCTKVYVDSDCENILDIASALGAVPVLRPEKLSGDNIDHGLVIRAVCNKISEDFACDAFLVLLGNTVMIDSQLINEAINMLESDPSATSVCSVWKAADDHPMRAMNIDSNGYLVSHPSVIRQPGATTDRSSYTPAYFYDQGIWLFRSANLQQPPCGPATWNWLGAKPLPLVREWITGRDINGPFDFNFHKYWDLLKLTPDHFPVSRPEDLG